MPRLPRSGTPHAKLACIALLPGRATADQADEAGRDFPKTLIFDEPGIDDEISLPTLIVVPREPSGTQTDVDFELDKRLTTWLSLQINVGYSAVPSGTGTAQGWQNTEATLKMVALADAPRERLVSFSFTREFGGSGAQRIGAARGSATPVAVNFGQGWSPLVQHPLLKPFAITGSLGLLVPDRPGDAVPRQAILSASLQYSLDVLAENGRTLRLPAMLRPLIPIVECLYTEPDGAPSLGTLAPGLIYAGRGFQVAAEALLPLTKATGAHAGFIAQLNISLTTFGWPALASVL